MWQLPVGIGVGVLLGGQSPQKAALLSGTTLIASAAIRAIGWRATATYGWAGLRAVGAMSMQGFAGAVIGGAIVGTVVSYGLFGKEGAKDAVDFYTNPLDLEKGKTILSIPSNLAAITQGNRAVANNAAGLPTGENIYGSDATRQEAWRNTGSMVGNENISYW